MTPEPSEPKKSEPDKLESAEQRDVASVDEADLDSDAQKALREAYLLQQRRMRCPGCGEADEMF